jgi:hypothetical protein
VPRGRLAGHLERRLGPFGSTSTRYRPSSKRGAVKSVSPLGDTTSDPPQKLIVSSMPTRLQKIVKLVVSWA